MGQPPWNPIAALRDRFRVVAMDQRNTGTSFAPITATDGWDDYAADQLGLMDHLGIDRFAVVGMCIGGAFIAKLLVTVPERVSAAVAMQPIGLDDNRDTFDELYAAWRDDVRAVIRRRVRLTGRLCRTTCSAATTTCGASPTRTWPRSIARARPARQRPVHPAATSERMAADAPGACLIHTWKDGDAVAAAKSEVDAFLDAHAPSTVTETKDNQPCQALTGTFPVMAYRFAGEKSLTIRKGGVSGRGCGRRRVARGLDRPGSRRARGAR